MAQGLEGRKVYVVCVGGSPVAVHTSLERAKADAMFNPAKDSIHAFPLNVGAAILLDVQSSLLTVGVGVVA